MRRPGSGLSMRQRIARAEDRVLDACDDSTRPSWLLSASTGTVKQAAAGIGLVVRVEGGHELYLNVKPSQRAAASWLKARATAGATVPVGLVVVLDGDTLAAVLVKVVAALEGLRAALPPPAPVAPRPSTALAVAVPSKQPPTITPRQLYQAGIALSSRRMRFLGGPLQEMGEMVHDKRLDGATVHANLVRLATFVACTEGPTAPLAQVLVVALRQE